MGSAKRPRKRHVQTDFTYRKRDKNQQWRGGRRKNAGRKPIGKRAGAPHKQRPSIDATHPQHVTLRIVEAVGWIRKLDTYRAVRRALATAIANHHAFRVVHVSVQNTHIHLLCEASDKTKLAKGLQGFQISAAKHINAVLSHRRKAKRRGQVFGDRYHCEDLGSPTQVRNALAYVINNWRHHRDDRGPYTLLEGRLDPYASGLAFEGWHEPVPDIPLPPRYERPPLRSASTWLLRDGWRRARGRAISMFDVPGPRAND